jgi:uncharacterized membrane protein
MSKEIKKFKIRYNTHSKSEEDRWRLIEDGNEYLVSNIEINGLTYTTKDWMPELDEYKWHISCEGYCEIKDSTAYVTTIKEESVLTRHILKTISWRLIGTIDTMILGWIITGNPITGLKIGALELLTKMTLYFIHERIWYKYIRIGSAKTKKNK